MKKIMFNDHYGLTEAVLAGYKTMTRRIATNKKIARSVYKIGDVVAIAQSYSYLNDKGFVAPEWLDHTCEDSAGYNNKLFVRADLMPHRIRITSIKSEHLQDINDDDCIKEGVMRNIDHTFSVTGVLEKKGGNNKVFNSPREAFAALIDQIFGKETWQQNPWVYAYSFELCNEKDY